MKTVAICILVALMAVVLFPIISSSQNTFQVKGMILDAQTGEKVPDAQVKLYKENELIDAFLCEKGSKFDLTFEKNNVYTIVVDGFGYISKKIQVNTSCNNESKKIKDVTLNIKINESDILTNHEINQFDLDFPYAILEYHEGANGFIYCEHYIDQILKLEHTAKRIHKKHIDATYAELK